MNIQTISKQNHKFKSNNPFILESGKTLTELEIAYTTLGELNEQKDNVIWICHALTANSDPAEWWDVLVGEGKLIDTNKYFIVCANMLGSCYGTTNALSTNPQTGREYLHDFPSFTVRDIAASLELLRKHLHQRLGINKIKLCIGGSMGGQQALEWVLSFADKKEENIIENLGLIATNAKHSAWGIAFNESQRMAIENDPSWKSDDVSAGMEGMKVARSIALLSYRNYEAYTNTQTDKDERKADFSASSYQRYQGDKLAKRFDAFAYYNLSKAMDTHHIGRDRGAIEEVLSKVDCNTSVVSISNDILFPPSEQQLLADCIPNANYHQIHSTYGHDGFLLEEEALTTILKNDFSFFQTTSN